MLPEVGTVKEGCMEEGTGGAGVGRAAEVTTLVSFPPLGTFVLRISESASHWLSDVLL